MKLWLDDLRTPPTSEWTWVKTAEEAIRLISKGKVNEVSLDNDLGLGYTEGYEVLDWLEEAVSIMNFNPPTIIKVHSANPVARDRMQTIIERITGE